MEVAANTSLVAIEVPVGCIVLSSVIVSRFASSRQKLLDMYSIPIGANVAKTPTSASKARKKLDGNAPHPHTSMSWEASPVIQVGCFFMVKPSNREPRFLDHVV